MARCNSLEWPAEVEAGSRVGEVAGGSGGPPLERATRHPLPTPTHRIGLEAGRSYHQLQSFPVVLSRAGHSPHQLNLLHRSLAPVRPAPMRLWCWGRGSVEGVLVLGLLQGAHRKRRGPKLRRGPGGCTIHVVNQDTLCTALCRLPNILLGGPAFEFPLLWRGGLGAVIEQLPRLKSLAKLAESAQPGKNRHVELRDVEVEVRRSGRSVLKLGVLKKAVRVHFAKRQRTIWQWHCRHACHGWLRMFASRSVVAWALSEDLVLVKHLLRRGVARRQRCIPRLKLLNLPC
mmetsp:Transcript_33375/g.72823  ORF Transcript_33375/g.72823 Transcript_33375/m.72823 type:complete len:288 (+) Transcript_33375:1115-1978(+)